MKSYNYDAQLGGDTDDMELVRRYGLDSGLAYTPHINDAIRKAVAEETVSDLLQAGYKEGQARKIANEGLAQATALGKKFSNL